MPIATPHQRRLGEEIRRLRKQAGLTLKQVGAHLGVSEPQVGRIETAKRSCSRDDLAKMLELFGTDAETASAVFALWEHRVDHADRRWWDSYSGVVSSSYAEYLSLEAAAERVIEFHPMIPPGLLQTESYAYALTQATGAGDDERVEALVEVRMERKKRLTGADELRVQALTTEAVLHVQVGGPHVMAGQFEHMIELAERPNIELRITPFATGAFGAVASGFTVFDFPSPHDPSIVLQYVATSEAVTSDAERDLRQVRRLVRRIERAALSPADTVKLIKRRLHEMGSDTR